MVEPLTPEEALRRLASWDEMAGNGDPAEFPAIYREEVAARINLARATLDTARAAAPVDCAGCRVFHDLGHPDHVPAALHREDGT